MSETEVFLKKELVNIKNRLLYPILVIVIIGLGSIGVTYFRDIRRNSKAIEGKVDQIKFNKYLTLQSKINTLSEERQKILLERVEKLENSVKRIDQINIEIARLQERIKILLSDYTMKTRDGGEVLFPIDYFITEA